MEKFKGTTEECLLHHASTLWPPKGSRSLGRAQKALMDFAEVKQGTIARWLSKSNEPIGLVLVRLRFYLEAAGYEVTELRMMRGTANYKLAEMLAYGVVTQEQASKELAFTEDYSILRIAHGGSSTTSERIQKIEEMHKKLSSEIKQRRSALQERIEETTGFRRTSSESSVVPFAAGTNSAMTTDEQVIASVAHVILAITPLLERLVQSPYREERELLRSYTGSDGMFNLSKASSRLCSEKAREIVNGR